MSSLTVEQFKTELKIRSDIIFNMDDDDLTAIINMSLRRFSGDFPKLKWSYSNAVVDNQVLYDYPTNAVKIINLRDSASKEVIDFTIEEDDSESDGDQIRPGSISGNSFDEMLESNFYDSPLVFVTSSIVTGYSNFDIEYALLQTIATINDRSLEALSLHVEYLAYGIEANKASQAASVEATNTPESLTDSDADGSTTTVKYTTQMNLAKGYRISAGEMLKEYKALVINVPYGGRA